MSEQSSFVPDRTPVQDPPQKSGQDYVGSTAQGSARIKSEAAIVFAEGYRSGVEMAKSTITASSSYCSFEFVQVLPIIYYVS
jgi:hypothetical protein